MIESTLKLNIHPKGASSSITVSQYDVGSRKIIFEITGGYTVPTDAVVHLRGTKPDDTGFDYMCDVSEGKPSIVVQEQMTAVPGNVVCELAIYEDSTKLHTEHFIINVIKSALINSIKLSKSEISMLETAGDSAIAAAKSASAAKASADSASSAETKASSAAIEAGKSQADAANSANVASTSATFAAKSAASAAAADHSAKDSKVSWGGGVNYTGEVPPRSLRPCPRKCRQTG